MNASKLFDDIARTLASPIPRRQAFRHILWGIAGAALASVLESGTARADGNGNKCKPSETWWGNVGGKDICCPQGWICWNLAIGLCCPRGQSSCGNLCCPKGWTCCNGDGTGWQGGGTGWQGDAGNGQGHHRAICCSPSQICDRGRCKSKPSEFYFKSTGI